MKQLLSMVVFTGIAFIPWVTHAHQPRIPEGSPIQIENPEISKAYYGVLSGEPVVYEIKSPESFNLYVNILAPGDAAHKKDLSFAVLKDGNTENPLVVGSGYNFPWEYFFEEYGHDFYWKGPEYREFVEPGNYEVRVWSSNNDSKYVLAVGAQEYFDAKEAINALRLIPKIKKDFFEESPVSFLYSPIGMTYVVSMIILGLILGSIVRAVYRRFILRGALYSQNLGIRGRLLRTILCIALVGVGVSTTWHPGFFVAGGFLLFESITSQCLLVAYLRKKNQKRAKI